MKARDHKILAGYLTSGAGLDISYIYEKAFIIGNIEPDKNPFTYLHGLTKKEKFRGHNYENILPVMRKLFHSLQKKEQFGVREYYRLGKLIHYVADSFTFPHNRKFTGTLGEHCEYEKELHKIISLGLRKHKWAEQREEKTGHFDNIEMLHEEYLEQAGNYDTDYGYILQAAEMVLNAVFCPSASPECAIPERYKFGQSLYRSLSENSIAACYFCCGLIASVMRKSQRKC